jgi:hypothetical protein
VAGEEHDADEVEGEEDDEDEVEGEEDDEGEAEGASAGAALGGDAGQAVPDRLQKAQKAHAHAQAQEGRAQAQARAIEEAQAQAVASAQAQAQAIAQAQAQAQARTAGKEAAVEKEEGLAAATAAAVQGQGPGESGFDIGDVESLQRLAQQLSARLAAKKKVAAGGAPTPGSPARHRHQERAGGPEAQQQEWEGLVLPPGCEKCSFRPTAADGELDDDDETEDETDDEQTIAAIANAGTAMDRADPVFCLNCRKLASFQMANDMAS